MPLLDIVFPTIAMAMLIFAVTITLAVVRGKHMKANPPKPEDFADGASAQRYFAPVEMAANNHRNLFEMPVLFFALIPLLMMTGLDTPTQSILAWIFVLLRAMHSYVHIVPKNIPRRASLFMVSSIVLMAMWLGFAIDMARGISALAGGGPDTI